VHLHHLIQQFGASIDLGSVPDLEILGIQEDSRLIRTGDLFIARPGTQTDGARYVDDAHARGAVAVVVPQRLPNVPIPQVVISDPSAASMLAHVFHDHPSRSVKVLGVTGTNGKTTTTFLIRQILGKVNQRCGLIGTVKIDDGKLEREATMTTPGPVELADLIANMRNKGCRAVAIEVSSHALHQRRAAAVRFAGAGFTNLTGDHLDYHGTMEQYADAKAMLFETLSDDAVAAVNADDPASNRMVRNCRGRVIRFGIGCSDVDYRATDIAVTSAGSHFVLITPDGRAEVRMGLIGRHNIENALCAAALVGETFGLTVHQIANGLRDAQGAPGRLQAVRSGQKFAVLVDYAHSDDALKNVLSALRPLTRGKLRVVFGCGGDRDRTKRPRMGQTAADLADVLYITSDNPRTENPKSIVDEIVSGLPADTANSPDRVVIEVDRRHAIERALGDAVDEDVVLIAGKGHENYQIVGKTKHHFDDVEEATRVLMTRMAV
jgi:UDP-N-acetylmuramoyl-L-alanyl-D-glutamate--2,6-diaminopimelate ligase